MHAIDVIGQAQYGPTGEQAVRAGGVDLGRTLPAQRVAGPADGPAGADHVVDNRDHLAADIEVLGLSLIHI